MKRILTVSAAVLIMAFIYILTVPPTIYLGDSGEIVAAAATMGIPHPPGYPLDMLAGKIAELMKTGDPAFRMNVLSAVLGSLCMALFYLVIRQFIMWAARKKIEMFSLEISSALIAVVYALSSEVWFESIQAKGAVYMLVFLLILAGLYATLKNINTGSVKYMYMAAYLSGFFIPAHSSAALYAFFIIILMAVVNRKNLTVFRTLFSAVLFFTALLTPYLYLFIRVGAALPVDFSFVSTPAGVINHIMRSAYTRHDSQPFDFGVYFFKFFDYFALYLQKYNITFLFVLAGLAAFFRRDRGAAIFSALFFIVNLLILVFVMDTSAGFAVNTTSAISAYADRNFYLIADILPALLAGSGVYLTVNFLNERYGIKRGFVLLVLCVPAAIMGMANFDVNNHSSGFLGYDHGMNIEKSLRPGDTLLVKSDLPLFNIVYLKTCLDKFDGIIAIDRDADYLDSAIFKKTGELDRDTVDDVEAAVCVSNSATCYFTMAGDLSNRKISSIPYGIIFKMSPTPAPVLGNMKISELYTFRDFYNNSNNDLYYRDVEARYFIMYARYAAISGDGKKADDYISLAFNTAPTSSEILNEIALTKYYYMGDVDGAIDYVRIIYNIDRHDMNAVRLLAALFEKRNPVRALEWLDILYKNTNDLTEKANIQADIDAVKKATK
jgi:hypothetical protein